MLKIDSREIMEKVDLEKLSRFFAERKQRVYDMIRKRLAKEPSTPYIRFVLDHPQGERRRRVYLDAFEKALRGKVQVFFNDQQQIGYKRAVEGYNLEDVFIYKMVFREVMWHFINEYNAEREFEDDLINFSDVRFIEHLIDYSNYLLSYSFLKTRDEIISRRRNQLHQLHLYAAKAVSIFQEEELRACANQGIYNIFGLNGSFLIPYVPEKDPSSWKRGKLIGLQIPPEFIEGIALEVGHSNRAMAIDAHDTMLPFDEEMDGDYFKVICIPIHPLNFYVTDLFFVHDQGRVFTFEKFDRNLLYQFSYFTGAVLSNSLMVSELADKQEELRNLSARLISIQEEERKRIAVDIHDTLTQALTAIGYKILLCQELMDKDPSRLNDELDRLVLNINEALKQSRHIISNLRPKILDDLGVVAAFKSVIVDFQEHANLRVNFTCPENLKVNSEVGIALFRIFQEALHNVTRHARASKVDISLSPNGKNELCLMVRDDGQGFDAPRYNQAGKNSGLGLLTMRERARDLGGQFEIASGIGEGCQIRVTVPL
jgi:signal transduction histidine kinase